MIIPYLLLLLASNAFAAEVKDTSDDASEEVSQTPMRKGFYLGFGGSSMANLNTTGVGFSFGAAYCWDVNQARILLLSEGDFNGAAFLISAGMGGRYFLTKGNFSPYLGGDFGAGAAKIDGGNILNGQTVGGFVVGLGTGVELLRGSAVSMDLGFRAGFLLHSNQLGTPQAMTLRLGLYF